MGAGFCSLYYEIHYIEYCYIEVWLYTSISTQNCQNFFFRPELFVNPPRVPSKRAYQRSLHESYQLMMKTMIDAANIEAYRKKKLAAMEAATNQAINKYKDSIPSEASEDIVIIANKDEEIEI